MRLSILTTRIMSDQMKKASAAVRILEQFVRIVEQRIWNMTVNSTWSALHAVMKQPLDLPDN